ncbi:Cytosolic sulfotransferase 12 [Vitis vinifera]|uniref:Sulfotransferase n=1 Tax=Vitis vinifera TaxID=29760 RepID=A0A438BWE7_VITVI|nr:Cytosolic sulfotransferase 12 [Vitis vinifera]
MKWLPQSLYKPVTCAAHMLLAIKQGDTAEGASSCQALNLPSLLPMICKKMGSLKNAGTYSPPSLQKKDDFLMSINTKVFGFPSRQIQAVLASQQRFQAQDTDILLVTTPKSGTTWLKAMVFALVNRVKFPDMQDHHPLLTATLMNSCPYFEHFQPS